MNIPTRKFVATKSATLTTKLKINDEKVTGYYFYICDDLNRNNHYFDVEILYDLSIEICQIRNCANSKYLISHLENDLLLFDHIVDDTGFDARKLDFYNECPKNEAIYISRTELKLLLDHSEFVVLSGAKIDTGIPIDDDLYHTDPNGNLISSYFTIKFEGFVDRSHVISSVNLLRTDIDPEKILVLGQSTYALTTKYIGLTNSETINQDVPVVSLGTPCPPRWRPGGQ